MTVTGREDDDFVDPEDVVTLGPEDGLPEGKWIKVHRGLNWDQEQALQLSLTGGTLPQDAFDAKGNIDPSKIKLDVGAANVALLTTWVVAWNLTYKGQIMPIEAAYIRMLKPDRAAQIVAAIRRHAERVTEGNATPSGEPTAA